MGGSACSQLERAPGQALSSGAYEESGFNEEDDEFDLFMEDSSSATGASAPGDFNTIEAIGDLSQNNVARIEETVHGIGLLRSGRQISREQDPLKHDNYIEDIPPLPDGVYDFSELPRPYAVFKQGLFANPDVDVKVTIGPVVGKVTDTSAIILLEVDSHVQVTLNFAPIHENRELVALHEHREDSWTRAKSLAGTDLETMLFVAEGSCTLCHVMQPGKPSTFEVWGLRPATSYLVLLSNVSAHDMTTRIGRFTTMAKKVKKFRVAALCGNRLPDKKLGFDSPWHSLLEFVRKGPDVQVVLQAGLTIDARGASLKAKHALADYSLFQEGCRKDMEEKARDCFRAAFRSGWGDEEAVWACLAGIGSNLPVFAPPCQLEAILQALIDCGGHGWKADEWQAVLRASIDVYYEYQRALWHESASMTKGKRSTVEKDSPVVSIEVGDRVSVRGQPHSVMSTIIPMAFTLWTPGTVTSIDPVMVQPEGWQFSYQWPEVFKEDDGGNDELAPDEISHMAKLSTKIQLAEEWHYHKYGGIGIFMLDTKGSRLRGDGAVIVPSSDSHDTCALLQPAQWDALKEVMQDDSLQVLLLVSDLPFFSEDATTADNRVNGTRKPSKESKRSPGRSPKSSSATAEATKNASGKVEGNTHECNQTSKSRRYPHGRFFDWCSRPGELCRLLARAFEWKYDKYPHRELVLVSGGHSCGTFGDVCDHDRGLSIPLVVTGPLCDKIHVQKDWALCGSVGNGRFSYVYRSPLEQCNFCIIDIDLGQGLQKPSVDIQLVSTPLATHIAFPDVPAIPDAQLPLPPPPPMHTLLS